MSAEPTETPIGEPAGVPGDFALADMEFLASGDDAMLVSPCVDCGVQTGRMCDHCYAVDKIPASAGLRASSHHCAAAATASTMLATFAVAWVGFRPRCALVVL